MDVLHASPKPVLDLPSEDRLHLEFDAARRELVEARRAQEQKDTPDARRRVAECRTRLDTVLDMWNDAVPASR
jgi:hypothetical protein